jgi:hypothetical protein
MAGPELVRRPEPQVPQGLRELPPVPGWLERVQLVQVRREP